MTSEAAVIAIDRASEESVATPGSADLVARARRGDTRAFEHLLRIHERRVVATAWRLLGNLADAEDAAQEVFLRLYRYLHRFDNRRAFEPWIYRVTVNVCRDLGRRRNRRDGGKAVPLEESPEASGLRDAGPDPAARAVLDEERRIAEQAIATLAEKERAALVLRDVQGLSTLEVTQILGSSEITVRSQICRARFAIEDQEVPRPETAEDPLMNSCATWEEQIALAVGGDLATAEGDGARSPSRDL